MPAWLTWTALKGLPWKWIGLGLAIVALILWIDHRGYRRGFHSRDTEVARITQDRDTYKANAATLQGALDRQNAAVTALKADADKRTQEGVKALEQARKANAGLLAQAEALRKSAGIKYGKDDPCVISDALVRAGKI